MMTARHTLTDRLCIILGTDDPAEKAGQTRQLVADWHGGRITGIGTATPPDRPGRPGGPELKPPRDVTRRRAPFLMTGWVWPMMRRAIS